MNISEDCICQVDVVFDKLYLSVFHWEYSPWLYLITLLSFRLHYPQLESPSPSVSFLSYTGKFWSIIVSFFRFIFLFHQYVTLSSNKWNFEDLTISQKGSNLLLPNFQNSEALLIIKYPCLAKLYMYIYLCLHLSISLTIYSDMNTY